MCTQVCKDFFKTYFYNNRTLSLFWIRRLSWINHSRFCPTRLPCRVRADMPVIIPDLAVSTAVSVEFAVEQHRPGHALTRISIGSGNRPVNRSRQSSITSNERCPSWRDRIVVCSSRGMSITRSRSRYRPCCRAASKPSETGTVRTASTRGSGMRRNRAP